MHLMKNKQRYVSKQTSPKPPKGLRKEQTPKPKKSEKWLAI